MGGAEREYYGLHMSLVSTKTRVGKVSLYFTAPAQTREQYELFFFSLFYLFGHKPGGSYHVNFALAPKPRSPPRAQKQVAFFTFYLKKCEVFKKENVINRVFLISRFYHFIIFTLSFFFNTFSFLVACYTGQLPLSVSGNT